MKIYFVIKNINILLRFKHSVFFLILELVSTNLIILSSEETL